jgi:hypothetical protein
MKLPPSENKSWEDDVLADRPNHGMSPEAAHRILEMNPAMREKGADTGFLVNQAHRAHLAARGEKKDAQLSASKPAVSPLATVRDADHLFNLAQQRLEQERRELETQLSLIQAKLAGMKERHLGEVMDKLAELDANLSSVVTQASLQSYKKFLDSLGFSPQKFIERLRAKRGK